MPFFICMRMKVLSSYQTKHPSLGLHLSRGRSLFPITPEVRSGPDIMCFPNIFEDAPRGNLYKSQVLLCYQPSFFFRIKSYKWLWCLEYCFFIASLRREKNLLRVYSLTAANEKVLNVQLKIKFYYIIKNIYFKNTAFTEIQGWIKKYKTMFFMNEYVI